MARHVISRLIDFFYKIVLLLFLITLALTGIEVKEQSLIYSVGFYSAIHRKIVEAGIKYPDLVYAQAIHETGNFSSAIYWECFNAFGMKKAYKRYTNCTEAPPICNGHCMYTSIDESIQDYLYWQQWTLDHTSIEVNTEEDYIALLERVGYAEDKKYVKKLKKWRSRVSEYEKYYLKS